MNAGYAASPSTTVVDLPAATGMRAIDARPLAATSAALTTGGARAAACFWINTSAAMRVIGAIAAAVFQ